MRRILPTIALLGTLGLGAAPARAHVGWLGVGAGFRVGDVHFSLAFGQPRLALPRALYYRTAQPLYVSHGVRCSDSCYHQGAVYYHHEACPLVRSHFARLRVDPYSIVARYAPPVYGDYDPYAYRYRAAPRYYAPHAYAPRFEVRIGSPYRYRDYGYRSFDHRGYDRRGHDRRSYDHYRYDRRDRDVRGHAGPRNGGRQHDDRYRPGNGRGSSHHPRR